MAVRRDFENVVLMNLSKGRRIAAVTVTEFGYSVDLLGSDGVIERTYCAGNHKRDSGWVAVPGTPMALPVSTLVRFARRTAREMLAGKTGRTARRRNPKGKGR